MRKFPLVRTQAKKKNPSTSPRKGLFITCEGGEGAGKSTLFEKLQEALTSQGYEVILTREPGGSDFGEFIRDLVLRKDSVMSDMTELLLFLAARAQHINEKIKPALLEGKIVLCDRFNDSTIAYQGYARGLGVQKVQQMCELVCDGIYPDLTFFLDVSPVEGLKRTRQAKKQHAAEGEVDRIEGEKLDFHQKVYKCLQQLALMEPNRIVTIDATLSKQAVFKEAWKQLSVFLT